jgi:C4-dicarboxylate-specific signal transduction histidine kinase
MPLILLVEDEDAHAELVGRSFRSRDDMELAVVEDLKRAHARLEESTPDVIVADLRLPDGSGTELLPKKNTSITCPVIIMTSHGDERAAVDAMKFGAFDYVVKSPESLADMPHIIDRVLREQRVISERKHAEECLKQQELQLAHVSRLSTLGEMVAGIAHEINQPLMAIASFAGACELTLDSFNDPRSEQLRNCHRKIQKQAILIGEIIQRIRGYVNKSDTTRSDCNLDAIARESIELLSSEARRLRVRVDQETSPSPHFFGSRVTILQVIVNLLRNAYEALQDCDESERVVLVRSTSDSDAVQFSVHDRGPGLSADFSERAFDPFCTTKPEGMGMGLAISRSIIEAHCGRLWFTSHKRGGTAFHFKIPINPMTLEHGGKTQSTSNRR